MTDNANEAAKMNPRIAGVAGGRSGGGGLLEPLCFFADVFADVVGLGWRCLSSESDIGKEGGGADEESGCPPDGVYTSCLHTHWRFLIRMPGEFSLRVGKEREDGGIFQGLLAYKLLVV